MAPHDAELIARSLVDRDTAAFDELIRRHQSRVRAWLRHLSRDATLADDIAQDTFLRAWRKLGTYKASGSFDAWLMTIARNEFLQDRRKAGRERMHGPEPGAGRASESPLGHFNEECHDIERFLDVLKPDERDAMILVYGFDLSHRQASEVSGLPLGTVKSHLRRGISKIREKFDLQVPAHD